MTKNRKTGKCPRCCPDGGAIFTTHYLADETAEGHPFHRVWRCNNCFFVKPLRALKALTEPTTGQKAVIDRLSDAFGGTVKVEMMGRMAWVTLDNDSRSMWDGLHAFGKVHANGRFSLSLHRPCADEKTISEWWAVKSYFTRYNPVKKEETVEEDRRDADRLKKLCGGA